MKRKLNKGNKEINREESLYAKAWSKLKKNKPAMFGMFIIAVAAIVSILGGNIRPDESQHANNTVPSLDKLSPGTEINHLLVRKDDETVEAGFFGRLFMGGSELQHKYFPYLGEVQFEGSQVIIENFSKVADKDYYQPDYTQFELAAVIYPLNYLRENNIVNNNDGTQTIYLLDSTSVTRSISDMQEEVKSSNLITKKYWLGTDKSGRDFLSRLMAGTIVSLSVGFIAVALSLFIGLLQGMLAGFYRGWVDNLIMYIVSVVWSVPALLILISFMLVAGRGFTTLFVGIGIIMWVDLARLVRGQVLSIREKEYIEAGRSLGFSDFRILFRHVLPNIVGPVIVQCANNFAIAILLESGLSYLGIGVQIPMASWGVSITDHADYFNNPEYAFTAILPGIFILLLVFAFMLLGNGLRDAFDSRSVVSSNAT